MKDDLEGSERDIIKVSSRHFSRATVENHEVSVIIAGFLVGIRTERFPNSGSIKGR